MKIQAFRCGVFYTWMISRGKVDRRTTDNLISPGRDTLNFHVGLRAVSYHDTPLVLRAACLSNRKYRVSSWEEARRVLSILEINVGHVIALHYPVESAHTACRHQYCSRKISILYAARDLSRRKSSEGSGRRFHAAGDNLRSTYNNCSQESLWRHEERIQIRAQGCSTKFNAKHPVINALATLGTGGCGFRAARLSRPTPRTSPLRIF